MGKAGGAPSVSRHAWPEWVEALTVEELVEVVFQINGKIRAKESLPPVSEMRRLGRRRLATPRMKELLDGKEIRKVIVVPGKLVNVVASV